MTQPFASMAVDGFDGVARMLRQLPEVVLDKSLPPVMRKAGRTLVTDARRRLRADSHPYGVGLLVKSLGLRLKRYRRSGIVFVAVGPRTGFFAMVQRPGDERATRANPTNYAHLVELGFLHRSGKYVAPKPFLRPAMDTKAAEITRGVAGWLGTEIPKQAAKLAAKGKL